MIEFWVNGEKTSFTGDEDTPLLWVLRDDVGLTGTKYGCGIGQCGACTVHVDGRARRSCSLPINGLAGKKITTIEGLAVDGLTAVQRAWMTMDVPQCGYCQAGQIMAVTDFLEQNPNPTDDDIDREITNICRCGTYVRIRQAIHLAAQYKRRPAVGIPTGLPQKENKQENRKEVNNGV